ncbi:hypothetical protein PATSB16_14880 [Pandoraea thiooxydans]|nr:hypothetical protein PATSB16_14880 [Pandoraea thiooxydans]
MVPEPPALAADGFVNRCDQDIQLSFSRRSFHDSCVRNT